MNRGYKSVIMMSFLGLAGCLTAGLSACGELPPVRFQLGGLQGAENVEFTRIAAPPEMQIVTFDHEAGAVAKEVLFAGGVAADAAAAMGFTLSVTSPASVGLGGGGVCVSRAADGAVEGLDFRSARLGRGLFALHAKYGTRPWSSLVVSAETLARFGHKVSPALAEDVAKYGGVFITDPNALAVFMTADRRMIAAGDEWRQPRLADSLARLRNPRFMEGTAPASFAPEAKAASIALSPGSTGFAVADKAGATVACAFTMGRPFGLGSITRDGGYLFPATSSADKDLDQLALGFLACLKRPGGSDTSQEQTGPRCPAPASTLSLMP